MRKSDGAKSVSQTQTRSGWSFKVGVVSGIPIRIHATFFILLLWLVLGTEAGSPLIESIFVLTIFLCVLLHELGHALTAQRFNVETRDITLYPFGGIASIVTQPTPRAELVIALAGPLVNVVIALAIYPWIDLPDLSKPEEVSASLPVRLFLTNCALALFNMLPALPMDGGRVLRAILALRKVEHPTRIAARVSQVLCVLLAIAAIYLEQPMLFVIAIIVFLGAMQEQVRVETRLIAANLKISEAMIPRDKIESFTHGTTLLSGLNRALVSWQPLFPVISGDSLVGIVTRSDIIHHAALHEDDYISEIMDRSTPSIDINSSMVEAIEEMERSGAQVMIVTEAGRYVGLLSYDRLTDLLLMRDIRQKIPKEEDIEWQPPL
jgi:Zn-dependent protease/CBS domain-containing protein